MERFTLQDKYVCGSYFNIAMSNFRITVLNILSRIGIKRTDDSAGIPELLQNIHELNLCSDLHAKLSQLLFRHFPILQSITASNLKDRLMILTTMAWGLHDLRNFYTDNASNYSPESLKVQYARQVQISKWLSDALAKMPDKDKKWLEDYDSSFTIQGQNMLSQLFIDTDSPAYQEYLEELYQQDRERRLTKYRAEMDKALERDDEETYGFYRVLSEKKDTPEEIDEIKKKICPPALSDFGVLYFCSLFLSRNDALLMADQDRGMKQALL